MRRTIVTAILLLLAGAVITVLVSWRAVTYTPWTELGIRAPETAGRVAWRAQTAAPPADHHVWAAFQPGVDRSTYRSRTAEHLGVAYASVTNSVFNRSDWGDRWIGRRRNVPRDDVAIVWQRHEDETLVHVRAGWPLPALEGRRRFRQDVPAALFITDGTDEALVASGAATRVAGAPGPVRVEQHGLARVPVVGGRRRADLPVGVLAGGFAVNALAYAAALGVAVGLVRWLVRKGRRPPYACRRCGYDLRGVMPDDARAAALVTCSECGVETLARRRHAGLRDPALATLVSVAMVAALGAAWFIGVVPIAGPLRQLARSYYRAEALLLVVVLTLAFAVWFVVEERYGNEHRSLGDRVRLGALGLVLGAANVVCLLLVALRFVV